MAWDGFAFPVANSKEGFAAVVSDKFEVGARGRTPPHGHMGHDIMGFANRARALRRHPNQTPNFTSRPGTVVVACGPGVVIRSGALSNGGRVAIDHGFVNEIAHDGRIAGAMQSLYLHLERIFVDRGERVSGGRPIGLMGFSPNHPRVGDPATGPIRHLHFEVWLERFRALDKPGFRGEVDPTFYVERWQRVSMDGAPSPVRPIAGLDDGTGDVENPNADGAVIAGVAFL